MKMVGVPVTPACWASQQILVDLLDDFFRVSILFKLVDIQFKLKRDGIDYLVTQCWRSKQFVMKFPKLPLFTGSKSGACGRFGKFMKAKGHIFENYFNSIVILLEHLLEKRRQLAAVRSFKIREYRDG